MDTPTVTRVPRMARLPYIRPAKLDPSISSMPGAWMQACRQHRAPIGPRPAPAPAPRREVENDQFAKFCARILRAYTRRVGDGRLEDLASLRDLRKQISALEDEAVRSLRNGENPRSWAEIGNALGVTRQSAQQRFGHVGGARVAGGQPGELR